MAGEDKLFVSLAGEPVLARAIEVFDGCAAIGQVEGRRGPGPGDGRGTRLGKGERQLRRR